MKTKECVLVFKTPRQRRKEGKGLKKSWTIFNLTCHLQHVVLKAGCSEKQQKTHNTMAMDVHLYVSLKTFKRQEFYSVKQSIIMAHLLTKKGKMRAKNI